MEGLEGRGSGLEDSSREPRWCPTQGSAGPQALTMGYGYALAAIPPTLLQKFLGLSCRSWPLPTGACDPEWWLQHP